MNKRRGMLMATYLVLVLLVVMLAGALLTLRQQNLNQTVHLNDRLQALELARSGVNHVVHLLTYQPTATPELHVTMPEGRYLVTWVSSSSERSVNNLNGAAAAPVSNFRGEAVPPHTCDVLVRAWSNRSRAEAHVVLRRGVHSRNSASADGHIVLNRNVQVNGVETINSDAAPEAAGGLFSRFSALTGQHSIAWNPSGGSISLGPTAKLQTVPATSGASFSSSLTSSVSAAQLDDHAQGEIPTYDIAEMVSAGASSPQPANLAPIAGGSSLYSPYVSDERHVSGDLTINNDITLSDGTLYVDGDLTLNGGVKGAGSIFVTGNLTIRGGNSAVMTNQKTGAALFAGGDVTLEGLDARGYLDSLAATHPTTIGADLTILKNKLALIESNSAGVPSTSRLDYLNHLTNELCSQYWPVGSGPAGRDTNHFFVNSIRNPSGDFPEGNFDADIPALVASIRQELGPAVATDVQAQRVIKALEEVHYQFRHNQNACKGDSNITNNQVAGNPDSAAYNAAHRKTYAPNFDDTHLPFKSRTIDSMRSSIVGGSLPEAFDSTRAFFRHNPVDLSWVGRSYIQGVVYAQGNVTATNHFSVVGAVMSHATLNVTNSVLTFDRQYTQLEGARGPLQVVRYEEQ